MIKIAVIEVSNTKRIANLIRYCSNPEKCKVKSGWNMSDPDNARKEMLGTRQYWNKNQGIQGFHVIQSFRPGEVGPGEANRIGLELAKKIGSEYEVMIYTHENTAHIHNHIVINSVSWATGQKFHQTNNKNPGRKEKSSDVDLRDIKLISDQLCRERGLSVIESKSAPIRKTMPERQLEARGELPWKNEVRAAIDIARLSSINIDEFKEQLKKENIGVNIRGSNISYLYPGRKSPIRGTKLGEDYTLNFIQDDLSPDRNTTGKQFMKIKELREQMQAEPNPSKKANLFKQFEAAKTKFKRITKAEKQLNRTNKIDRDRNYDRR